MWKIEFIVALLIISDQTKGISSRPDTKSQDPQWVLELKLGIKNADLRINNDDKLHNGCDSSLNKRESGTSLNGTFDGIRAKSSLPLVEIDGGIYYFERKNTANYFDATQFCKKHGMELLSIETEEENTAIVDYAKTKVHEIEHFWTSGNDLSAEGHFTWLATGEAFTYTHWKPSLPDNVGEEDCLEIRNFGNDAYFWNDMPCLHSINFICELKECTDFCLKW